MFDPGSDTYGNGTRTADIAGYKGNDNQLAQRAHELVRNRKVIAVKEALQKQLRTENIANRRARQQFWTEVMMSTDGVNMSDRLRASELLGRSEADFTDNVNASNKTLSINVVKKGD